MSAQVKEILILNGKERAMASTPPIPKDSHEIEEIVFEKGKKGLSGIFDSTACCRGYVATWKIEDVKFYFVDIKGLYRKKNKEPIFADWFTGELKIPQGKLLKRVHLAFASVYEEEIHIKIKDGIVQSIETIDNRNRYFDEWTLKFWDKWKLQ